MLITLIALARADWDPGPGCSKESYSNGPFTVCVECEAAACAELSEEYTHQCTNYVGDSGDTAKSTEEEFQVWCVLRDSGTPSDDTGAGATDKGSCGCASARSGGLWQAGLALALSAVGAVALRRGRG